MGKHLDKNLVPLAQKFVDLEQRLDTYASDIDSKFARLDDNHTKAIQSLFRDASKDAYATVMANAAHQTRPPLRQCNFARPSRTQLVCDSLR